MDRQLMVRLDAQQGLCKCGRKLVIPIHLFFNVLCFSFHVLQKVNDIVH